MFLTITTHSRALLTGTALALSGSAAWADTLTSDFTFRVVETDGDGAETLAERASVRPGEVIHYEIVHANGTPDAVAGLVVSAPVPEGVTFAEGTQTTSRSADFQVQAELDPEVEGLEWSALPATRVVIDEDGNRREEPLPAEEIAAVRWTLTEPLPAGDAALNTYRVRVD